MAKKRKLQSNTDVQGVALIDLVIEQVHANPRCIAGFCNDFPLVAPQPLPAEVIETLRFPNGEALSPSLKRWLAFDSSWLTSLGWFAPSSPTISFTPRRLDQVVVDELGDVWQEAYHPLGERFETCFLLPDGCDSRRIYAVTAPDQLGEYPVLVVDIDDNPYAAVMYPGFDVYMADLAGVIECSMGTYTDLFDDPRYAERLQWHANALFHGKSGIECFIDEEWMLDPSIEV